MVHISGVRARPERHLSAPAFVLASFAALGGLACGSSTGLEDDPIALSLPDGAVPECATDMDCEDGFACTLDDCEAGSCRRRIDALACETGTVCATGTCTRGRGCVTVPLDCDDGVACTVDACADPDGCAHTPDAALCPISHRCDPVRGCIARALIHDSTALYEVDLPSGDFTRLTRVLARLTDIALASDRQLYGVDTTAVYRVDESVGTVERLFDAPGSLVALEEGPERLLYGAALDQRVFAMEPATGRITVVARLPTGWVAAGDIAFVEGRMLITVSNRPSSETGDDQLAEVFVEGGTSTLLGPTGFPCVWALAAFGDTLYGFTCRGELLRIDPFGGAAELLRVLPLRIGGAAAR